MENPEEILHSLEEFSKMKPKDIPRELEDYIKFVAKTGDPVYQWSAVKSLFREKLVNVITEFYESCSGTEIPPCPNVEMFNYDLMKNYILEKLDTFASAPFTLQRICELLTTPQKEYSRIDKYMRALEKNILVVSTMEPGGRRTENGEGIMNGIESDHEHVPEPGNEINVEEMDESPYIQTNNHAADRISFDSHKNGTHEGTHIEIENSVDTFVNEKNSSEASTSNQEIVCVQYVSIEPVAENAQNIVDESKDTDVSVTITAVSVSDDSQTKSDILHDVQQSENIAAKDTSLERSDAFMTINKPFETDVNIQMEVIAQSSEATETLIVEKTELFLDTNKESIPLSTTVPEDSPNCPEIQNATVVPVSEIATEKADKENVSPEDSITSSDSASNESCAESGTSVEISSSSPDIGQTPQINAETENKEQEVTESTSNVLHHNVEVEKNSETEVVDSTTEVSEVCLEKAEVKAADETNVDHVEDVPTTSNTCPEEKSAPILTETILNDLKPDAANLSEMTEVPNTTESVEVISTSPENEEEKVNESMDTETKKEESASEEKETPMEVDVPPDESTQVEKKEETPMAESVSTESS